MRSDPSAFDVHAAAWRVQNVQSQARTGISIGSGSQFSANVMLPQWQPPRISMDKLPHRAGSPRTAIGEWSAAAARRLDPSLLEGKADLDRHLPVRDLAGVHVTAGLDDLEPLDVADRLRCARERESDRIVAALRRGSG